MTHLYCLQTTILESRDACEIKLTKPLKFVTGRIDCNNENENLEDCVPKEFLEEYGISDAGYITCKAEVKPVTFIFKKGQYVLLLLGWDP